MYSPSFTQDSIEHVLKNKFRGKIQKFAKNLNRQYLLQRKKRGLSRARINVNFTDVKQYAHYLFQRATGDVCLALALPLVLAAEGESSQNPSDPQPAAQEKVVVTTTPPVSPRQIAAVESALEGKGLKEVEFLLLGIADVRTSSNKGLSEFLNTIKSAQEEGTKTLDAELLSTASRHVLEKASARFLEPPEHVMVARVERMLTNASKNKEVAVLKALTKSAHQEESNAKSAADALKQVLAAVRKEIEESRDDGNKKERLKALADLDRHHAKAVKMLTDASQEAKKGLVGFKSTASERLKQRILGKMPVKT